jgi:hypothetical protein
MSTTPPGWHTDPNSPGLLRWWDGQQWTSHTAPAAGPAPEAAQPSIASAAVDRPVAVPNVVLHKPKGGLFSGGKKGLEEENAELREALAAIGAVEREQLRSDVEALTQQRAALEAELAAARSEIVATREEAILQEVGIYRYRHPLDSAVGYKARLSEVQESIKAMARGGKAVVGATNWSVNGSTREGTAMVRDFSKLMLRAYNNEADNAVRSMRPYALDAAAKRLEKARTTISRLGKTMNIHITPDYHRLRLYELELAADYLAKAAEEKELERENRQRLREEELARREYEREKERLAKQAAHYASVLATMRASGDEAGASQYESKLAEIQDAINGVEARAANTRAGYVYVISNVGSFGPEVVKIGMTRRLEPMDRVRELGDASVPFRYDVHALIFSEDAVTLETALHRALADRKVNLVNAHREFFFATPAEVRDLLASFHGDLLSFESEPEAAEWHQSRNASARGALAGP